MSRFSVEKNMVANLPAPVIANPSQLLTGPLNFPATFEKFTIGLHTASKAYAVCENSEM